MKETESRRRLNHQSKTRRQQCFPSLFLATINCAHCHEQLIPLLFDEKTLHQEQDSPVFEVLQFRRSRQNVDQNVFVLFCCSCRMFRLNCEMFDVRWCTFCMPFEPNRVVLFRLPIGGGMKYIYTS